jgi:uncharacterized protein with HEPN domain
MDHKTALAALTDIRDAVRRVRRYTRGMNFEAFQRNDLVQDAVERCIEIISEASRRIPEELKTRHPEIPWKKVAGVGNVFRHDYDEVDPSLVWDTVTREFGKLARAVNALIRTVQSHTPSPPRRRKRP